MHFVPPPLLHMHTRSTQYPYSGRLSRVAQAILSSAVPGPATLLLNGTGQHAAFDYADQPPRPDLQGAGLTIMAWVRPRAARIGWASLVSLPPAACVHGPCLPAYGCSPTCLLAWVPVLPACMGPRLPACCCLTQLPACMDFCVLCLDARLSGWVE